jgi:Ala-tRNA(Pro) deacylase
MNHVPISPHTLKNLLREAHISFDLYEHEPIFTVAQGDALGRVYEGFPTKNLFFKDHKNAYWLLTLNAYKKLDLKKLAPLMGSGRLSFAKEDDLLRYLGVEAGSVTPLASINDKDNKVRQFLDCDIENAQRVLCHPLINSETLSLSPTDLVRFIKGYHHNVAWLDLKDALAI